MRLGEESLLLSRWLRDPLGIGGVMPSGADLSRMMARAVDPSRSGAIIELGGGTGAITSALLAAGISRDRLIVLEREPELHRHLCDRFAGLTVLAEDATDLAQCLGDLGVAKVAAVVSSLPMLSMPGREQHQVLDQAFGLLHRDGAFIQYTYGPGAPVSPARLADWGIEARVVGRSWRNLPPASVWRLRQLRSTVSDQDTPRAGAFLQQAAEACESVLQRFSPRRIGMRDPDRAAGQRLKGFERTHRQ